MKPCKKLLSCLLFHRLTWHMTYSFSPAEVSWHAVKTQELWHKGHEHEPRRPVASYVRPIKVDLWVWECLDVKSVSAELFLQKRFLRGYTPGDKRADYRRQNEMTKAPSRRPKMRENGVSPRRFIFATFIQTTSPKDPVSLFLSPAKVLRSHYQGGSATHHCCS